MKTIDSYYYNTLGGSIGIVLAEDEFKQRAYISVIQGINEKDDEEIVKNWGNKLSYAQAKGFFPNMINEEKYKE